MFSRKVLESFKSFLPKNVKSRIYIDKQYQYLDIYFNKRHIGYLHEVNGFLKMACIVEKRKQNGHTTYVNNYYELDLKDPGMYNKFKKHIKKHVKYVKSR